MDESAMSHLIDGLDIETYIACQNEDEGKYFARKLGQELNLGEVDVMYSEFDGFGVRVRLRKYVVKPGDKYEWIK
jgi:alkyl hydroperoxide reductase subunit AhpF